jgi:hypothetical protein
VEVDTHIGAAMSGLIPDARTLVDHARVEAQNHRFNYNEPMRVEALTQAVCDLALNFAEDGDERKMSRPFGEQPLIHIHGRTWPASRTPRFDPFNQPLLLFFIISNIFTLSSSFRRSCFRRGSTAGGIRRQGAAAVLLGSFGHLHTVQGQGHRSVGAHRYAHHGMLCSICIAWICIDTP